jgi:NAD(P)-dependent dehydrogenase (short-subunit alcohol dehydrogenase family)
VTALAGRVALVVGADNAVGAAVRERLTAQGARVAVLAGNPGGGSDALDPGAWDRAFARETARHGGLDLVVNARHYVERAWIEAAGGAAFGAAFRRNASANWLVQKSAILALRRSRPGDAASAGQAGAGGETAVAVSDRRVLINVLPVLARIAAPGCAAVCAAARGLLMSTRSAALECARARDGLIVSAVLAGRIDGDARHWPDVGLLPRAPLVTPDDVAAGVLFLATDGAAYMTGVELPVDGGLLAS